MTHESNNPCEQLVGKIVHVSFFSVPGVTPKVYGTRESQCKHLILSSPWCASGPVQPIRKSSGSLWQI